MPGVVHATDYDMGRVGSRTKMSPWPITTSRQATFTSWNNGWAYRNDGVDIEPCNDNVNSNGFNVGWTAQEEWLNYTVEVGTAGLYDIELRVASQNGAVPST